MKKKRHRLKRTEPYSPIIAVIGGKNISDNISIDYGTAIHNNEATPKTKTKIMKKRRIRKIFTKSEE